VAPRYVRDAPTEFAMALSPDALIFDPPHLHGASADGTWHEWALGGEALRLLSSRLQPGWRTLETGAGVSTVLFAMQDTQHTCIVPDPEEVARITEFCAAHGISTDRVTFIEQNSEDALPRLEPEPLDLVLLDGSHSFPSVFIDWYYTARRLKIGGWLFVDDTHIWTGRVLREFLQAEPDWELVEDFPYRTAIFRTRSPVFGVRNWIDQPYVVARSASTRRREALMSLRERSWHRVSGKLQRLPFPRPRR